MKDLFPNAKDSTQNAAVRPAPLSPIQRAEALRESGEKDQALELLTEIPLQDPNYVEAQELLKKWKEEDEANDPALLAKAREDARRFSAFRDAARRAYEGSHYIRAGRYFDRAAKIAPLGEKISPSAPTATTS